MAYRYVLALLATLLSPALGRAQSVGIGTSAPSSNAALEVRSTSKGLLLPRLTTEQMNAISNPEEGLLIYNTTLRKFCGYQQANTPSTVAQNSLVAGNVGTSGGVGVGQSFTATGSGRLTGVTLNMGAVSAVSGTLTMKLYDNEGLTGPELGTVAQAVTLSPSFGQVTFDWSALNLNLTASQKYTFYITGTTIPSTTSVIYGLIFGNRYAGGQCYQNGAAASIIDLEFRVAALLPGWVVLE